MRGDAGKRGAYHTPPGISQDTSIFYNSVVLFKGGSMKLYRYVVMLFILSSVSTLYAAAVDPLWLFTDRLDPFSLAYGKLTIKDTCRSFEFNQIMPVDTGTAYDKSYINFSYQFSADQIVVVDEWSPTDTVYRDLRPGYAGFKLDWDDGITGYSLGSYKYLVLAHKGPLAGHKVTINFGYNSGCGTPTFFENVGSFTASAAWKIDSIAIPESIRNVNAAIKKERNYYEMQILINNVDANGSPTSEPGALLVDDIALVGIDDSSVSDVTKETKKSGCGAGAGLAFIPLILLKARKLRKRS